MVEMNGLLIERKDAAVPVSSQDAVSHLAESQINQTSLRPHLRKLSRLRQLHGLLDRCFRLFVVIEPEVLLGQTPPQLGLFGVRKPVILEGLSGLVQALLTETPVVALGQRLPDFSKLLVVGWRRSLPAASHAKNEEE